MWSMPRLHKESITCVSEFGSWKPVSTAWESQLKGDSQRGQEPLDTQAEDTAPLEATAKQCSEDHDREL
jgi:hypothetical protein